MKSPEAGAALAWILPPGPVKVINSAHLTHEVPVEADGRFQLLERSLILAWLLALQSIINSHETREGFTRGPQMPSPLLTSSLASVT